MKKFKDAFNGIKVGLSHKAVRIQFILGFLAVLGGFIIKLDVNEWLAFIICIVLIIAFEMINTCVEELCNIISPEYNEKIKRIKDLSAGFVLVGAIGAFVICVICVLRRIL